MMYESNLILNEFRKDLCDLFESQGFIVEREKSKRKECDHVFLEDALHEKLKIIDFPNRVNPLAAIQRDKEKIRLRFYYHQLDRYKGLKKALTSPKLKNDGGFYTFDPYKEAICFDFFDLIENPKTRERAITFVNRLIARIKFILD